MFVHYSKLPIERLYAIEPQSSHYMDGLKPKGFWFSVFGEADWWEWCHGEDFGLDRLVCGREILIRPQARVLTLDTADKLDEFHARYRLQLHADLKSEVIDWPTVADNFDVLVIAPYRWDRRMHSTMLWYYGWDCASGIAFNHKAIKLGQQLDLEKLEASRVR